jgi:dihydropyrimidinase
VFAEVLAQHLLIDDSVYRTPTGTHAAHYVMSPPFRSKPSTRRRSGGACSPACCTPPPPTTAASARRRSRPGIDDFRKIPNGTGGVEDRMAVLWHHGVRTGRLTPRSSCGHQRQRAQIFNMYPRKGAIAPGSDADLVIWDPRRQQDDLGATHHQNIDFNIYEGMEVTGLARTTLSRGEVVWRTSSHPIGSSSTTPVPT